MIGPLCVDLFVDAEVLLDLSLSQPPADGPVAALGSVADRIWTVAILPTRSAQEAVVDKCGD